MNFDLVWRDCYSPIPNMSELPPSAWDAASSLHGVEWRPEDQLARYEAFKPLMEEFDREHLDLATPNGSYEGLDARVLYATIRAGAPSRVLELGSGYSTLIIARALDANANGKPRAEHIVADPVPSPLLSALREDAIDLRAVGAQHLPLEDYAALAEDDVLFIDTTHVVKIGSEVNFLLLEVIPNLASDVLVHLHDIFLPFEYPVIFARDRGFYWNEQYLLQGLLAGNDRLDVLLANHWLQRTSNALRGADTQPEASGIWLRTAAGARTTSQT